MLKSPMMTGADVLAGQKALNQHENAGLGAPGLGAPTRCTPGGLAGIRAEARELGCHFVRQVARPDQQAARQ
jgi:hypothetical protein